MDEWLESVEQNILTRRLLGRGESVLVAVSGGLDSMVLLHALARLAPAHDWRLTVAHFNHCLRGRSSDADERFVSRAVGSLNLPFVADRGDVKAFARKEKISLEMAARSLRHDFLAAAARARKISTIALAHHADDQVELFFLRLLRGAGGDGLAGMHWNSKSPVDPRLQLIRPLLDQSKESVQAFAAMNGLRHREDATNASLDMQRNRLRHRIIPSLAEMQPNLRSVVLRSMEIIGAESEFVLDRAQVWLGGGKKSPFELLSVAVQRRVVEGQLLALGIAPTFNAIELLRLSVDEAVCVDSCNRFSRTRLGMVVRDDSPVLAFDSGEKELDISRPGKTAWGGVELSWNVQDQSGATPRRGGNSEFFDADKVGGVVTLRHWRPGDRFQPIGMKADVRLQNLFVNAKISATLRRQRLLAVAGNNQIFWVEGLRISESFKLDNGTQRRLKWSWMRL